MYLDRDKVYHIYVRVQAHGVLSNINAMKAKMEALKENVNYRLTKTTKYIIIIKETKIESPETHCSKVFPMLKK